jgi:hypothetical protein
MLGFVSRFGSAKGMVAVPNFSGLNSATANSQLASAGLILNPLSGEIATNNSAQGGISLNQSPAAGTLVDYETPIVINFGRFVADTITISGCQAYGTPANDPDYCSGTLYVYGGTRTKFRRTITTTNNVTGQVSTAFDYSCSDTLSDRGSAYINGLCGYVTPPVTCTATTNYGAYSACNAPSRIDSSGTQSRTVSGTNTNCSTFSYTESVTCCQNVCNPWSAWDTLPSDDRYERRGRLCQYTDCSKRVEEQRRCKIVVVSVTYGGCGSNKRRVETTKTKNLCTNVVTTTTASVLCNAV